MNRMPRKSLLTLISIYPKCFDDVQSTKTLLMRWNVSIRG